MSSLQLSKEMSPGWKLGNSLEAVDTNHSYVWGTMGLFDRSTGAQAFPDLITTILDASK
jgi:hypothetical protein